MRPVRARRPKRLLPVRRSQRPMADLLQPQADEVPDVLVIVRDQNQGGVRPLIRAHTDSPFSFTRLASAAVVTVATASSPPGGGPRGSSTLNVEPTPSSLSTLIRP